MVVRPAATVVAAGLMAIAINTGVVTVRVAALEVTPFATAVIVVVPCARLDAMPLPLSVAMAVLPDIQVTDPDTLPVVPSE